MGETCSGAMHRSQALTVVKATARLKVLAAHAREHLAAAAAYEAENGVTSDMEGGAGTLTASLLDSESLAGGSPLSGLSRPVTPLSDLSLYSAAASLRAGMVSAHVPPAPWYTRDVIAVKEMLLGSKINILMLCVPLGVAAQMAQWGATAVFMLNFLALIPLALLLGDVTEDLAVRFGDTVGGLLNATFGNIVEMILSIAALQQGLYTVVSTSLLGSILSNLLLVLGCCFLFGGLKFKTQAFNAVANQATSSLLFLSCIGIIIPTAAVQLSSGDDVSSADLLDISRGTAVIMLVVYLSYLGFQLHTHHDLFKGDDGDEEPIMTFAGALTTLAGITLLVAVCSEYLCSSIEEFSATTGLSQAFLGMIVLPIAGNACEHITAVVVAMKNKMDLSLGVAVGSSIQIAIFAIPFVVIVGWVTGHDFTLDFDPFATLALTVSVIHANFVTSEALSHWLMGVALITNYAIIALVFLYKS
ncbi:cation exchanger 1 [Scenedesmus sp. NREL 46B-D3]|nr:cation exchanger 1 [Scenedesmus sp. NREL 46B-D3]